MKQLLIAALIVVFAVGLGAEVVATRVSVGVKPTAILANTGSMPVSMVAVNQCTASVFLGGSAVATTDGLELLSGASVSMTLSSGEALYGIVASSTCRVDVLKNRDQ